MSVNFKKTKVLYPNLTDEVVLYTDKRGYTVEEHLIFQLGGVCTFFDDLEEYQLEMEGDFKEWLKDKGLSVTYEFETINGRIAVVAK